MCFDLDSSPPINKISGASVSHQDTVLTSADGTEFAAFIAEGGKEKKGYQHKENIWFKKTRTTC